MVTKAFVKSKKDFVLIIVFLMQSQTKQKESKVVAAARDWVEWLKLSIEDLHST